MFNVFNLQWLRLKREPILAVTILVMTLLFVYFMVGTAGEQTLTVQTYSENLSELQMEEWLNRLNKTDAYVFEIQDRETIEKQMQMSQITFALELDEDNYQYLVGQDSQFLMAVDQHVGKVYRTHLKIDEVNEQFPDRELVQKEFVGIESRSLAGVVSNSKESSATVITGVTLYFSVLTILYGLMNIVVEKRSGTWDRMISTPLKKSQIYVGRVLHHFSIGILQIGVSFLAFYQLLNYNFGSQYLSIIVSILAYVFAVVSLGMLIVSIVKSPQQLQAVIPIVSTGMAMLGGAFWPLEIIVNKLLLVLARITPIYYGMDALKGAILYNRGIGEILQPLSVLFLMGILFMGIGINLMEGKK